jgi:hypothetical protein
LHSQLSIFEAVGQRLIGGVHQAKLAGPVSEFRLVEGRASGSVHGRSSGLRLDDDTLDLSNSQF